MTILKSISFLTAQLLILGFTQWVAADSKPPRIVLLMLDGVRWQELYFGSDPQLNSGRPSETLFPELQGRLAQEGVFFGNIEQGSEMIVANPSILSLPAYQSIMTGRVQPCFLNSCGRVKDSTFQERLVQQAGITRDQVATIASWDNIAFAVEREPGTTFVNTGTSEFPNSNHDPVISEINRRQAIHTPTWEDARFDEYTYALALRYLEQARPSFLFISLNDSDAWGHLGDYSMYTKTLRTYDRWIGQLVDAIDAMGEEGEATTLIVTTDHGRGDGPDWKNHSLFSPASRNVWMYIRNSVTRHRVAPQIQAAEATSSHLYSHADLRPTIEALMGLTPHQCFLCGTPIEGVLSTRTQSHEMPHDVK